MSKFSYTGINITVADIIAAANKEEHERTWNETTALEAIYWWNCANAETVAAIKRGFKLDDLDHNPDYLLECAAQCVDEIYLF